MPGKRYAPIYARDGVTCQYCGNCASTVDHLMPRRTGGSDDPLNLVSACKRCNKIKGHLELPNLVRSFRILLSADRTLKNGYAPLFWQALQLEFPVEDAPWSERRSSRALKQLARALFQNPDQPRAVMPKEEALALLTRMQACSLEKAHALAQRLLARGYVVEETALIALADHPPPYQLSLARPQTPPCRSATARSPLWGSHAIGTRSGSFCAALEKSYRAFPQRLMRGASTTPCKIRVVSTSASPISSLISARHFVLW